MVNNEKRLGFFPGWRKSTYIFLSANLIMLAWTFVEPHVY